MHTVLLLVPTTLFEAMRINVVWDKYEREDIVTL